MENNKFNATELKMFNLIREGKSRNEVLTSGITTPACANMVLCMIYEKTDDIVKYRSARDKFKELQGYLRNNPTAFTPIPDKLPEFSDVPPYAPLDMKNYPSGVKAPAKLVKGVPPEPENKRPDVHEIIKRLNAQYKQALEVNKAKLSVLDDIEHELTEGA